MRVGAIAYGATPRLERIRGVAPESSGSTARRSSSGSSSCRRPVGAGSMMPLDRSESPTRISVRPAGEGAHLPPHHVVEAQGGLLPLRYGKPGGHLLAGRVGEGPSEFEPINFALDYDRIGQRRGPIEVHLAQTIAERVRSVRRIGVGEGVVLRITSCARALDKANLFPRASSSLPPLLLIMSCRISVSREAQGTNSFAHVCSQCQRVPSIRFQPLPSLISYRAPIIYAFICVSALSPPSRARRISGVRDCTSCSFRV